MEKKAAINKIINTIVIFALLIYYVTYFNNKDFDLHFSLDMLQVLLCILIVLIFKAFFFHFILFGKNISFCDNLYQYLKATAGSMVFPFILGQIWRIYCYSYQINSYVNGIIIMILEKFMYTLTLVTIIILSNCFYDIKWNNIIYIRIFFLVITLLCYILFKQMHHYWKKYFLSYKASKKSIIALKILDKLQNTYYEIYQIIKGKFLILYVVSFITNILEIWIMRSLYQTAFIGIRACTYYVMYTGSTSLLIAISIKVLYGLVKGRKNIV